MSNLPKTSSDVSEALNNYFKLKLKYETQIMNNKRKIITNQTLSKREKRAEFLKLKPACINCKRPGGTRFNVTFFPETENESFRQYSAACGIISDPCKLNIKIQLGNVELLPNVLNNFQTSISNSKKKVIDNKNKLLFGYLTTEEVLTNFEELKYLIEMDTSLYDSYLTNYNDVVDNDQNKLDFIEATKNYYALIEQIKNCMKKMTETTNVQYAKDAVVIYETLLVPLLEKLRLLKYNESFVWAHDETNDCCLIQNKYSIQNMLFSTFVDNIEAYNVGFEKVIKAKKVKKTKTKKLKTTELYESDESEEEE
jgi:hypothetical protein